MSSHQPYQKLPEKMSFAELHEIAVHVIADIPKEDLLKNLKSCLKLIQKKEPENFRELGDTIASEKRKELCDKLRCVIVMGICCLPCVVLNGLKNCITRCSLYSEDENALQLMVKLVYMRNQPGWESLKLKLEADADANPKIKAICNSIDAVTASLNEGKNKSKRDALAFRQTPEDLTDEFLNAMREGKVS